MRHLVSVVLALVLTPLIYISTGYSAAKLTAASASGDLSFGSAAVGLLAAFVAGALYALLVMARLSPIGPVLGSLIYIGITVWALLDLDGFTGAMPSSLFGVEGVLTRPVGAGTLLLAVPMLFTVFSPRRWRAIAKPEPTGPAAVAAPGSATSGYEAPTTPSPFEPPVYTPPAAPTYVPPVPAAPTFSSPPRPAPSPPSSFSSPAAPTFSAPTPTRATPAHAAPEGSDDGEDTSVTRTM